MTATQNAEQHARQVERSSTFRGLARLGYVGYGVLNLAIAWLAVHIALGDTGRSGDPSGALSAIAEQPFGRFLLIAIAIGLATLAVWQLIQAAIGHRDVDGMMRVAERVVSGIRTLAYAGLSISAIRLVAGVSSSNGDQQQNATAGLMAKPGGQFLVGLIGLIVVGAGAWLVYYGLKRKFERKLNFAGAGQHARRATLTAGQVGYAAKGVAYAIVGVLLTQAALTGDVAKSRGLDAALRSLTEHSWGTTALIVIGLGFGAFGIFCFFRSRYLGSK